VTQYDAREASRNRGRDHNPHALPLYLAAVDDACAAIDNGASIDRALADSLNGRLLACVSRGIAAWQASGHYPTGG